MPPPNKSRLKILTILFLLPFLGWMGAALHFRLPGPLALRELIGALAACSVLVALVVRPRRQALAIFGTIFMLVLGWYLSIRPSNDRTWRLDVAKIASAEIVGSQLTVHNVRNCVYRAEEDFDVVFEDRQYDLSQVKAMDLFLVSWGPRHIAHTIMSWDFGDGRHLAFSIETRKQTHQQYSAVKGFFREYELCMVAGDERDLIGLRTNFRKEQVRLYRLNTPPRLAQEILRDFLSRASDLSQHPEWYNALVDNCTTAMLGPIRQRSGRLPWSWKLIASGHMDELLYDRGIVSRSLPLEELRTRSLVNAAAEAGGVGPGFSQRIRADLPSR